ncbi:MAG: hypothetical protein H6726_25720 [Sandaracinaceae bacterium]|nr:hypothetical protein [Myxococcales bacterium]MCB9661072.1 hypothetical protein [Sandaracinaceae bacterium]
MTHQHRFLSSLVATLWLAVAIVPLPLSSVGAQPPRTAQALVLLLSGDGLRPELVEALRVEALSNGYGLVLGAPPVGDTGLQRAAAAQAQGAGAGARATLWLEEQDQEQGGGVVVRALSAGLDDPRYAPLPAPLAEVAPRTFAVVAGSLLDELEQPPARSPMRVRVRVEVDIDSDSDDPPQASAEMSLGPDEGTVVAVSPGLAPNDTPVEAARPAEATEPTPTEPEALVPEAATPVESEPAVEPESAEAVVEGSLEAIEDLVESELEAEDDAQPPAPEPDAGNSDLPPDPFVTPFGADVLPFVGTSSRTRGRAIRHYSINLFGGIDQELRGAELSMGFGMYRGDVTGAQLAGVFNYVGGDLRGVQLAGGANFVRGDASGVQLAGALNYAGGDVHGAQVGPVNVASGTVHGVQVGLVNYSEDVDFALGLLNIVRNGRTHLELTGSSDGFFALSLKHGGRHFHYIYSGLTRPDGADDTLFGAGMGIGARATLGERVFLDLDTLGYALRSRTELTDTNGSVDAMMVARVMLGIRLFSRLSLVAGASYSGLWSRAPAPDYGLFGTRHHDELLEGRHLSSWPSILVGLQVL